MSKFLTLVLPIVVAVSCASPATQATPKTMVDDLVTTFTVEGEQNIRGVQVSKKGNDYFISISPVPGQWPTPTKAKVVTPQELPPAMDNVLGAVATEEWTVLKVAVGWKTYGFQSKTGYVLTSRMVMLDLHRVK